MDVKSLRVKVISAQAGNHFVRKHHYSGKIVQNSCLHLGVFSDGIIHGAMQFGSSLDKRKMLGLVKGTGWNEFLELNRLAFDDTLPKNSESRCLSIAFRMIKKNAPHVKWILSFADGCQSGDGTIYRAVGFKLIGIKKNTDVLQLPDGTVTHSFNLKPTINSKLYQKYGEKGMGSTALMKKLGASPLIGYQIKYIYFLKKEEEKNLTVPILPYSELKKKGAQMYLGKRIGDSSALADTPGVHPGKGGSIPTLSLQ